MQKSVQKHAKNHTEFHNPENTSINTTQTCFQVFIYINFKMDELEIH